MRIINPFALARDFKSGKITETEKMHYLLFSVILLILGGYLNLLASSMVSGESTKLFNDRNILVEAIAIIFINIIGIIIAFRTNQKGDGNDFIGRFICFSLSLGIWFTMVNVLAGILTTIALEDKLNFNQESIGTVSNIVAIIFSILFYLGMKYFIAIAAGVSSRDGEQSNK